MTPDPLHHDHEDPIFSGIFPVRRPLPAPAPPKSDPLGDFLLGGLIGFVVFSIFAVVHFIWTHWT